MKHFCKFICIFILFAAVSCSNPVNNNFRPASEERILFIRYLDGPNQICTIKPDGTDLIVISQITPDLSNSVYIDARWSPDKSKIVVVGGPEGTKDIWPVWLMDMNGNLVQKLSNNGNHPIWKNNNEIYYYKRRNFFASNSNLYLFNIKEKNETNVDRQVGNFAIFLTDIDLTGDIGTGYLENDSLSYEPSTIIVTFPIENWSNYDIAVDYQIYPPVEPRISPNGESLFFVKGFYENNNIFLLNLISKNETNLSNNLSQYEHVIWSPDSRQIAYDVTVRRRFAGSVADIFIIDVLTGGTVNITNTASQGHSNRVMDWK